MTTSCCGPVLVESSPAEGHSTLQTLSVGTASGPQSLVGESEIGTFFSRPFLDFHL